MSGFLDSGKQKTTQADLMFQIDDSTSMAIISPRTYLLRKLQEERGQDNTELKNEQRGLAPITFMHHVSKIIEGKTESFRVRICRTCSGLPTLLELGSYSDVESALLINDAHEIMQGRYKYLHLLVPSDLNLLNTLCVKKRGCSYDCSIITILNEKLSKSNVNIAPKQMSTTPMPEASIMSEVISNSAAVGDTTTIESGNTPRLPAPAVSVASKTAKRRRTNEPTQFDGHQCEESNKWSLILDELKKCVPHCCNRFLRTQHSYGDPDSQVDRLFAGMLAVISGTGASSSSSSSSSSTSSSSSSSFSPRCKEASGATSHPGSVSSASCPFSTHTVSVDASSGGGGGGGGGQCPMNRADTDIHPGDVSSASEDPSVSNGPSKPSGGVDNIFHDGSMGFLPRGMLLALVSSLCACDVPELSILTKAVAAVVPNDNVSVGQFATSLHAALNELKRLKWLAGKGGDQVPAVDHNVEKHCPMGMKFLKLAFSCSAYSKYVLRLCKWSDELGGVEDAEIQLQGVYGQLETRTTLMLQYVMAVLSTSLDNTRHGSHCSAPVDNGVSDMLRELQKRVMECTIAMLSSLASAAMIVWKLCFDSTSLSTCLRVFNNFLPLVKEHHRNIPTANTELSDLILRRHADLLSTYLLSSRANDNDEILNPISLRCRCPSSIPNVTVEYRLLAFSLGEAVMRQALAISMPPIPAPAAMQCRLLTETTESTASSASSSSSDGNFAPLPVDRRLSTRVLCDFESALASFTSALQLAIALGECDLLVNFGCDFKRLLRELSNVLAGIVNWMNVLECVVSNTHTLVVLHSLVEICFISAHRFVGLEALVANVVHSCRLILWICSSRFVLAKMLLEDIIVMEDTQS